MNEVLVTVGLKDQRDIPRRRPSHGQKQWLEIGMLLMQDRGCCSSTNRLRA